MALPNLIFDRTQADADRWLSLSQKLDTVGWGGLTTPEQSEWLTQLKGAYNYTDLNRVGRASAYLGERFVSLISHLIEYRALYGVASAPLFELPYAAEDVAIEPKTDWTVTNNVRAAAAARLLLDLVALRSLIPMPESTPQVPSDMESLTFEEANDMEWLLQMIDTEITLLTAKLEKWIYDTSLAWVFSGEVFSQEV